MFQNGHINKDICNKIWQQMEKVMTSAHPMSTSANLQTQKHKKELKIEGTFATFFIVCDNIPFRFNEGVHNRIAFMRGYIDSNWLRLSGRARNDLDFDWIATKKKVFKKKTGIKICKCVASSN